MNERGKLSTLAGKTYIGLVLLFLYAPILVMALMSFNASEYYTPPIHLTLDWYRKLANNADILQSSWRSIWIAVVTTILAVIIGTAAVKNPGFLKDACSAFGGHIIVGLDAKDGKVATDGWSKLTGHEVIDLGKKFEDYGVESIIYTDIGRDGMLSGINIEATVKLAQALTIPVIASGGLSNMADIEQLCSVESEGVEGVICGRAIYTGDLDFAAAQARADELADAA